MLESAKAQKYQNIELIVSDDCSTDNTVGICTKWMADNTKRFCRTKLIVAAKNTGISANCNRGVIAAQGEWVKLIAGDDILDPNILLRQLNHIGMNDEIKVLWTNVSVFYDTEEGRKFSIPSDTSRLRINKYGISAREQFQILLRINPVFIVSMLIKREVFEIVGYFDENFPFFEDLPFIQKVLLNDIPINYLDIVGAYYRKHNNSIQISQGKLLRNPHRLDVYKHQIKTIGYYENLLERSARWVNAKYNLFFTSYVSNNKHMLNKILLYAPSLFLERIIKAFAKKYY